MSGRYAILGDIHGNWEALSAVLEHAESQGVSRFASVGDIVGYNACPAECLERVRELSCVVVRGNHDHYCSNDESLRDFHPLAASVIEWTRSRLSDEQKQFLRDLRMSRTVSGFTMVHSTLDTPERWGYVFDVLQAQSNFNYQTTSVCFHGHTHVPILFCKSGDVVRTELTEVRITLGTKYFINVGSVGQPRDGDPRAAYVLYDTDEKLIRLFRVPYDIPSTQRRILDAGLPERLALRLTLGR